MARLAQDMARIHKSGTAVVLVSSGAIAAGMGELGWKARPKELGKKQAAAAVGQPRLMETYRQLFRRHGVKVAQVLVTREDFENKERRKNAQKTLLTLIEQKVVPIINENDTVVVEEIRVGDNDTLAARVARKVQADLLVLLTDVDGLMSKPPKHGRGEVLPYISKITPAVLRLAHGTPGSDGGTGGMETKLRAAQIANKAGVSMVIASGKKPGILARLIAGESVGTYFAA